MNDRALDLAISSKLEELFLEVERLEAELAKAKAEARAAENEACAQIVDPGAWTEPTDSPDHHMQWRAFAADVIRGRLAAPAVTQEES